jgi:hypothetical protein
MKKLRVFVLLLLAVGSSMVIAGDQGIHLAKMQGYKALKVFVQMKDQQATAREFLQYKTSHFIVKYEEEDKNVVSEIAAMFEKSYETAQKEFGYSSKDKTVAILYKDQDELWNYQRAIRGQAVMGLYNMGTIHVLSPNAYEGEEPSAIEYFQKNGPVLHEYTHKVVDELTDGNMELWLTEGLALYQEYKYNDCEWAPDFQYERYFDAEEMRAGFMDADETQGYKQSLDMVRYLIETQGMDKMRGLLQLLKSGKSTDQAFETVYGMTADDFINSHIYAAQ